VPIVGAILVLAVSVIPGAAAARVTASPLGATVLAVLFAEVALLGGTVLSLAPGLPVSGYVATIAFLCYLVGRLRSRMRTGWTTNGPGPVPGPFVSRLVSSRDVLGSG
jgi:zinc/manganese transport system permease protein